MRDFRLPGKQGLLRFTGSLALCISVSGILFAPRVSAQDSQGAQNTQNAQAAPPPAITSFNAPGAGSSLCGGTTPTAINSTGAITGWFQDASCVFHGFLQLPDGRFASFDVPSAGINPDQGTTPASINDNGDITGYFNDEAGFHGFVRTAAGKISTFDVPNATDQYGNATTHPAWINSKGAVVGSFRDSNQVSHSFLRSPAGVITEFDPPSPASGSGPAGSGAVFISSDGSIVGWNGFSSDSYLRSPSGAITAIQEPNAGEGFDPNTDARGLDTSGVVAGSFFDSLGMEHGFLRATDGTFASFDIPGQGAQSGEGPNVVSINDSGSVAGTYAVDPGSPGANPVIRGFLRAPDGTIQTFAAPGANTGYCGAGTRVAGVNSSGAIVGWFTDTNCVPHGFVRAAADPPKGHRGRAHGRDH